MPFEGDPRASRIHLEGIDFGVPASRINLLSAPEFHWYYDRRQRALSTRGAAAHMIRTWAGGGDG